MCVFSFCFEGGVLAPIDRLTSSFSFSVRERRVFDRVLLNELRLGQVHQLLLPALSLLQRVPHIFRVRDSTNRHNRWRGAWPSGVTRLTFTVNDNLFLYTRAV